jgi:methylmalonyl-CoA mutase N-terminal domain/subunit
MPTLMGFDPDDPPARGEVGREGVSVASVADVERLFADIPLAEVTTSMTINAPAVVLLAFYVVVAERRGIAAEALRGTIQNDMLKEFIAQKEWICGVRPSLRIIRDMLVHCTARMPLWNTISISGYHIREAGATAVQELAFTLADGIGYVELGRDAGLDVDVFAPAAVVLLGRPQRLLRGDREAARGAPDVGAHHARPIRRQEPARLDACGRTRRPRASRWSRSSR